MNRIVKILAIGSVSLLSASMFACSSSSSTSAPEDPSPSSSSSGNESIVVEKFVYNYICVDKGPNCAAEDFDQMGKPIQFTVKLSINDQDTTKTFCVNDSCQTMTKLTADEYGSYDVEDDEDNITVLSADKPEDTVSKK